MSQGRLAGSLGSSLGGRRWLTSRLRLTSCVAEPSSRHVPATRVWRGASSALFSTLAAVGGSVRLFGDVPASRPSLRRSRTAGGESRLQPGGRGRVASSVFGMSLRHASPSEALQDGWAGESRLPASAAVGGSSRHVFGDPCVTSAVGGSAQDGWRGAVRDVQKLRLLPPPRPGLSGRQSSSGSFASPKQLTPASSSSLARAGLGGMLPAITPCHFGLRGSRFFTLNAHRTQSALQWRRDVPAAPTSRCQPPRAVFGFVSLLSEVSSGLRRHRNHTDARCFQWHPRVAGCDHSRPAHRAQSGLGCHVNQRLLMPSSL